MIPRDPQRAAEIHRAHIHDGRCEIQCIFAPCCRKLASFLATLYGPLCPNDANPEIPKPLDLIEIAWKFHRLGKKEMYEFLRILPMSIADLLNEWFEKRTSKGNRCRRRATRFICRTAPARNGSQFLHHQLGESNGAFRTGRFRPRRHRQSPARSRAAAAATRRRNPHPYGSREQ